MEKKTYKAPANRTHTPKTEKQPLENSELKRGGVKLRPGNKKASVARGRKGHLVADEKKGHRGTRTVLCLLMCEKETNNNTFNTTKQGVWLTLEIN